MTKCICCMLWSCNCKCACIYQKNVTQITIFYVVKPISYRVAEVVLYLQGVVIKSKSLHTRSAAIKGPAIPAKYRTEASDCGDQTKVQHNRSCALGFYSSAWHSRRSYQCQTNLDNVVQFHSISTLLLYGTVGPVACLDAPSVIWLVCVYNLID